MNTNGEVKALRDRVQELEALLGIGDDTVSRLYLALGDATPQQCEIIGVMLKRMVATRLGLFTILFGGLPDCDQPEIKIIDVQMVRIRKVLLKHGITIDVQWGMGSWSISKDDKRKLRALMARVDDKQAVASGNLHARRLAFLEGA